MSNWYVRAKRALQNPSQFLAGFERERANPYRRTFAFEFLEPRLTLAAAGLVTTPQAYSGALNGKIVFTSGGHGWQWSTTLGRYATDRGEVTGTEIVEDFGNQDQMTYFADYALRAGATVVPMRPVGRQLNEVVLDNDSPDVTFSGSWSNSSSTRFYDEDYGAVADAVPYKFASTVTGTETATATYTPNIPQAGFYPVYTWVLWGSDRTAQTYRINHTGGTTEVTVDHSKVGSGWVYLGTYHFNAGKSATGEGSVQIINKAPSTGKVVIADAIRFGNGMGDYIWTASGASTISGYPREDENSYHWIARSIGQGTTPAGILGSDNNVSAPSDFAQYMFHGTFGEAVYIGFHSNAGGGRGARGLIDASNPTPHQAGTNGLADILGKQINQDMQSLNSSYPGLFEFNWTTGTDSTYTSAFGEINLGSSAEMDATIIEVAFHDSTSDAAIMRDPNGRDQIARSVYQGTVQYFSLYGSPLVTNTSAPTPPTNVRVVSDTSGQVTLNWSAGLSTPASVYGAAATGYRVYASVDGYGFDGGRTVSGVGTTSLTITGLDPNTTYYFKVSATNAGGESGASEVVAALPSGGAKDVLIVSGFDRLDRSQNFRYAYAYTGDGLVDRVWPRYDNSRDYVIQTATAIHAAKPTVHFATASNEAVISGAVNLSDYNSVIWILGTESTKDSTFDATEQSKVASFINAGGNLFVSGSEIAWDLDSQNHGRSFFQNTLGASYVNDDANTYTATANAAGIFSGMNNFVFSSGASFSQLDGQMYNVAYPDVINPTSGSVAALTYSGGTGGTAAIQRQGAGGKGSIVMFGFPFETITDATRRQNAMGRILDFFAPAVPAPAIAIKTLVNGQDADSPTGPVLAAGSSATFTYVVTNAGNVAIGSIAVTDNNGTPGNAADDFNPTFIGGDTNINGQLDVGETWNYSATRTVVAGQFSNSGSVTGLGASQNLSASNPANYFGSAPAIDIKTRVNGQDANVPTGPILATDDVASFTYVLTNTGNVALSSINVVDDNGTPGNPADDFTPTSFLGGDTNGNGQLDLGETWTLSATRIVVAGQFSNIATASGRDSINQLVAHGDPANYFGSAPGISIQTFVNGQDANSPPGPTLASGSLATFTYLVTNTGNIALSNVVVTDDNGTPGNPADEVHPTFNGGDTNIDGNLDVGETWLYTDTRAVIAGQYTNLTSASGLDILGQVVNAFDPTNYFGAAPANADFNGDTIVDAADYVVWRIHYGLASGAMQSQGDANGDGAVDITDYNIWRSQFGTSPGIGGGTGTEQLSSAAAISTTESPGALFASQESIASPASKTAASAESSPAAEPLAPIIGSPRERGQHNRRNVFWHRSAAAEAGNDWESLLTVLAQRKTAVDAAKTLPYASGNTTENSAQSGIADEPLADAFGQFAGRKAQKDGF